MKCTLSAFGIVASVCMAEDKVGSDDTGLTLEQAYGPVSPAMNLLSWADRKVARTKQAFQESDNESDSRDSDYWTSRANCDYSLELVIVQDTSINSTVTAVSNELQSIFEMVQNYHSESKIGVASFLDKPKFPYGDTNGYCYRMDSDLTTELSSVQQVYQKLAREGGEIQGDIYNSQFDAVVNAATSNNFQWSQPSKAPVRLVVLATSTPPHFALDGLNIYGMPEWTRQNQDQCLEHYYPAPSDVLETLGEAETYLMVAVMPGLSQALAYLNYYWLTAYLGFTADFVTMINAPLVGTSQSLTTAISSAIEVIKSAECSVSIPSTTTTTTTPTPTTTVLTTTAVPTTEATTIPTTEATTTTKATPTTTTTATTTTIITTAERTTEAPTITTAERTTEAPTTTTVEPIVTPVGTTEGELGATDEECSHDCNDCHGCGCNGVVIELKHNPKRFELSVSNE